MPDRSGASRPIVNTAHTAPSPAEEIERKIASERADLLYAASLPMVVAFILAISLAGLLWDDVPPWAVLGWLALVAIIIAVRLRLRRAYLASDRQPPALWLERFARGSLALGLAWSLTGIVIWVDDDALCQALVILVACGMASGAVGSNAPHTPAVDRFIWPVFAVMITGLAWYGDRLHLGLAFLGLVYVASLGIISRAARRTITNAIRIKHDKEALIDRLAVALAEVEAAGRAKTSFLATMSHELRTPLNAIIGFSERVHEQRHGPLGATQ